MGLIDAEANHQVGDNLAFLLGLAHNPHSLVNIQQNSAQALKQMHLIPFTAQVIIGTAPDAFDTVSYTHLDIFIPGRALNNAFLGDAVLLDRVQQQEKGPSAAVKKVVEAGSRTLAGTIGRSELGGWEMRADAALRYACLLYTS